MQHQVNTDIQQEFAGTPLTHEIMRQEGFLYKLDELTSEQVDDHSDPFYYYKGEFRVYDVMDEFYIRPFGREHIATGTRVQTLEALQEAYIDFIGRSYTKNIVVEDTPIPTYEDLPSNVKVPAGFVKAKLMGGPGAGMVIKWPAVATFFIYQTEETIGNRKVKSSWQYKKRKNCKTLFDYVGPIVG